MPFARPVRLSVVLPVIGMLALSACGSGKSAGEPAATAAVSLTNCGHTIRVDAPPERAVSLNQGTTEIMLSLGLADRMVGTATWTDPVLEGLEDENGKVKRLADNAPSFERVLDTGPDFVAASFVSTLGKGGVATRQQFEKLGVPTYVAPSDCSGKENHGNGDGTRENALSMDAVYGEVRDLAEVFGVEERGEELVASLEERMEKATKGVDASGVTLMYWFANSESPYMAGCCGSPGIMTRALGAKNLFDDTREEWPQINWETVADRDPDVLVIGDLTRKSQTAETAEKKIEFLESDPVTKNMTAVKNKRYVLLSGQALNPTIRTVEGVERIAAALREYGLDG